MEYTIQYSDVFAQWLISLRDTRAKQKIKVRLDRILEGNFGDHKSVGDGVSELRIPYGAGYRVYYTLRNNTVVFLLSGGDKSTQANDIKRAKAMAGDV